ncbi:hypothetical protein A9G07_07240 [Gilliamella sp. wkB72]|uniref:cupin domain-containing protein n=1 Tax=Gilliamella sp. wkB72 TaxID=3120265 RepID=UPI0008104454|nr:cupin domain-containing protein [Gilliamella apicola]OCL22854.1 hypothetical protein A9G07_07240 [Gilliamella apicola]
MMNFDTPPENNDFVFDLRLNTEFSFDEEKLDFKPYLPGIREGVEIAVIFDESPSGGPDMAFLRYSMGSRSPAHVHIGYESVFVVKGVYIENGVEYKPGMLIVRAPGTVHSLGAKSDEGCIILASRYKPTQLIED